MYKIYCITNKINGKKYIGLTSRDPRIRFEEHMRSYQTILGKARLKHGLQNFTLEVLESSLNKEEVDERERFYIKQKETLAPKGYNLSHGGNSNKTISEQGRQKLREVNLGKNNPKSVRYILMLDKDTGEVLKTFGSAREAGRYLGNENKYRAISYCLEGKQKTSQGYKWIYGEYI